MSVYWSLPIRCDIIDILLNYVIANRMIELKCLIMNQNIYEGISLTLQIKDMSKGRCGLMVGICTGN